MENHTVVFSSKTRLYTNFYAGEPKEEYVVDKAKSTIKAVLHSLLNFLTEDNFVELVLSGASSISLGFTSNSPANRQVKVSELDSKYVKWLYKAFRKPGNYFNEIYIVEDTDGSLGIDFITELKLPKKTMEGKILDSGRFEVKAAKIRALYNVVTGVKYMFFKRLQGALSLSPGISIEDICDINTVDYIIDEKEKKLIRTCVSSDLTSTTQRVLWGIKPKVFIA